MLVELTPGQHKNCLRNPYPLKYETLMMDHFYRYDPIIRPHIWLRKLVDVTKIYLDSIFLNFNFNDTLNCPIQPAFPLPIGGFKYSRFWQLMKNVNHMEKMLYLTLLQIKRESSSWFLAFAFEDSLGVQVYLDIHWPYCIQQRYKDFYRRNKRNLEGTCCLVYIVSARPKHVKTFWY